MLRQLAPEIWVTERPLRFFGVEVGARMTVVRLRGGALWLHSPVSLDAALRAELDALGPVRFAVAPNRFHHLYAGDVLRSYPDAELHVAPGVDTKRPDLHPDAVLGDEPAAGWADDIDQLLFRGAPIANEVVFHHAASRTLILTDLAFHFGKQAPARTRIAMRALGARGFGPTLIERWLVVRDRAAARDSLERIFDWDFDRVVVAHGDVLESGGREALESGYAWLVRAPRAGAG